MILREGYDSPVIHVRSDIETAIDEVVKEFEDK